MTAFWRYFGLLRGTVIARIATAAMLSVLATGATVGLLALSGDLIARCAIAGTVAAFSFYAPSGGVRAFALTRILARYGERLSAHAISLEWLIRLRRKLFVDLAALPVADQRRFASGEVLDRAMADGDTVVEALPGALLPFAASALMILVNTAVLAVISPFAGAILAAGTAVIIAAETQAGRQQGRLAADVARSRGAARTLLIAAAAASNELISLGAIDAVRRTVTAQITDLTARRSAADRFDRFAGAVISVTMAVTAFGVLISVLTAPKVSLPQATLVLLMTVATVDLFADAHRQLRQLAGSATAARRLAAVTPTQPERRVPTPEPASYGIHVEVTGAISAQPSETLVVQGRSGSGKTTLLQRISDGAGDVWLDHRPARDLPVRTVVFVAAHEPLFTGTVAENLRLGAPDLEDSEIRRLLDAAGLDELAPDTPIGPGGRAVSGGEARRLAVLRAVAAQPRLLLLDEPTEGLDPSNAQRMLNLIRQWLPHATVIAAIHDRHRSHIPAAEHRVVEIQMQVTA